MRTECRNRRKASSLAREVTLFWAGLLLAQNAWAVTPPSTEELCENPLFNSTVSKAQANGIIGEMLVKFGVEPDFVANTFACSYYFSHIDLYMKARHEIDPVDFSEVREANAEFFACLTTLTHGSNEVFNEVRSSSSDKNSSDRKTRFSTPLDPTLVALCGMKEGRWRFPQNLF